MAERDKAAPDLDALRPRLFGGVPETLVRRAAFPRLPADDLQFLQDQRDLTCLLADALDARGVGAVVPAADLGPLAPQRAVCGQALTLRCEPYGGTPAAHYARSSPALAGDRDLYGLAVPGAGDIAVITADGDTRTAVAGDLSAGFAAAAGVGGILVDGAVRDVRALRAGPVPVWARGVTPLAARYRWRAAELNGTVTLAGARVEAGDLVAADANGVCVVPFGSVPEVLADCRRLVAAEAHMASALAEAAAGTVTFEQLITRTRGRPVL
ncbi:RraA family protein [Streptomyces sp. DH41]|uniref:RraA family protein n=1 Tax=Streptomyces sp. DH41 TaxID=3040125 RepID=UPI0024427150|nr:RraA family protein [Streptomyces sp. DH41]MDG9722874.1 RraA family protein [Streptomyces sp. DH41]